ncbi:zinc-binding dehydrogenase [Microbacterium sp. E-13]|uniref:zinc-binding dehydrogenase n=1 Tax=Microbacterium sp. E-13 TaxID=3404048 RepID=UPI003CED391C
MNTKTYELLAARRGALHESEIDAPGPGQLLIEPIVNGVCASDLRDWATGPAQLPVRFGHEPMGRIAAVGAGVDFAVGALVGGRIFPSYSTLALADAEDVVPIPAGVDPTTVLAEPLGCVAEGLRRTPVPLGAKVAVIGLGYMGLIMTQLLRNAGVAHLAAIDPRDDARAAAKHCGADEALEESDLPGSAFATSGAPGTNGYDVVIEASGSQPGLDLATRLVRPHGSISILGFHQTERTVDVREWNWKAIDVINAHVRDRALLRRSTIAALELQASGRIDVGSLVTHRFSFDRIDEAFEAMIRKPSGFLKAVIDIA